ncbi:energy-coupled thiamine transporter ThiT [Streptococcaceae bacterium ESL0687]|nr:energy-coupled thiamine transporter ThiT [Streptococcaceae bacterium ESL0687]
MSTTTKLDLRIALEATICASLAMVLSFLKIRFGWIDISLGQTIIILFGLRRGLKAGLFAGLLWGILHFLTGQVYYLSFAQVMVEYILAFVFAGTSGIFRGQLKENPERTVVLASIFATFARFFWHFIAGLIFWGQYAWAGWNPFWYSLVVNGSSAILTALVASLVLLFTVRKFPKIFQP